MLLQVVGRKEEAEGHRQYQDKGHVVHGMQPLKWVKARDNVCVCSDKSSASLQVVGEKEEAEGTVNVRTRDNVVHGMHSLESVRQVLLEEKSTRSLTSIFGAHVDAAEEREHVDAHAQNGAPVAS